MISPATPLKTACKRLNSDPGTFKYTFYGLQGYNRQMGINAFSEAKKKLTAFSLMSLVASSEPIRSCPCSAESDSRADQQILIGLDYT